MTEAESAADGPLTALAHITSFFTPAHEQALFDVYLDSEKE